MTDALKTLFLPLSEGSLTWPQGPVLFLRAQFDAELMNLDRSKLDCEQSFKPDADTLEQHGFAVASINNTHRYDLILILPPRQRDESRALYARALDLLAPGGRIVASVANSEGARSHEDDLKLLAGAVTTMSKRKCRVFWTAPLEATQINATLHEQWRTLDATRAIAEGRFVSRPGVFAWDRIDPASTLLAKHLPKDLSGVAADLGCGYGYLAVELLSRCPRITALDLYEAEQRALDLATENLRQFAKRVPIDSHWLDVTKGLTRRYDVIVSNPPFHTPGGSTRPDIGRRFIAVAGDALKANGQLWLVANRHLAYESVLDQTKFTTRIVTQEDGFKIIAVTRLPEKANFEKAKPEKNSPEKARRSKR